MFICSSYCLPIGQNPICPLASHHSTCYMAGMLGSLQRLTWKNVQVLISGSGGLLCGAQQGLVETARGAIQESQRRQKRQYDKRMDSRPYLVGARVMVYMPSEDKGKKSKLALPYRGPYRIVEVRTNTFLVRPVDVPAATPILVSMDRVTRCAEELPDES